MKLRQTRAQAGALLLFNGGSMELLKTVSLMCNVHALTFGPVVDGTLVLLCSMADNTLLALNMAVHAGRGLSVEVSPQYCETTGIHRAVCEALAVSINGKFLASGGNDHLIKLWPIGQVTNSRGAKQLQSAQAFVGHSDHVTNLQFSADGTTLMSVSQLADVPWLFKQLFLLRVLIVLLPLDSEPYPHIRVFIVHIRRLDVPYSPLRPTSTNPATFNPLRWVAAKLFSYGTFAVAQAWTHRTWWKLESCAQPMSWIPNRQSSRRRSY